MCRAWLLLICSGLKRGRYVVTSRILLLCKPLVRVRQLYRYLVDGEVDLRIVCILVEFTGWCECSEVLIQSVSHAGVRIQGVLNTWWSKHSVVRKQGGSNKRWFEYRIVRTRVDPYTGRSLNRVVRVQSDPNRLVRIRVGPSTWWSEYRVV